MRKNKFIKMVFYVTWLFNTISDTTVKKPPENSQRLTKKSFQKRFQDNPNCSVKSGKTSVATPRAQPQQKKLSRIIPKTIFLRMTFSIPVPVFLSLCLFFLPVFLLGLKTARSDCSSLLFVNLFFTSTLVVGGVF